MLGHFILFFSCHCLALLSWNSYEFNTLTVVLYTTVAIWNGAKYYMEYFAKKYEK